jgi:hypothetical protein
MISPTQNTAVKNDDLNLKIGRNNDIKNGH